VRPFVAAAAAEDGDLDALVIWDPETGNVLETTTCALEYFLSSGVPLDIVREIGRKWPSPSRDAGRRPSAFEYSHWWADQCELWGEECSDAEA